MPTAEFVEINFEAAADLLEKSVKAGGEDPHIHYLLALAYKHQGKVSEARAALRKITTPDANIVLQLGLLSLRERNLAQAAEEFARAYEMDPLMYAAGHNLLMTRLALGKLDECINLIPQLQSLIAVAEEQRFLAVLRAILETVKGANRDGKDWDVSPLSIAPEIVNLTPEDEQRFIRLVRNLGDIETTFMLLRSLASAHGRSPALQEAFTEAALAYGKDLLDRCRWGEVERLLLKVTRDRDAMAAVSRPTQAALYNVLGCCACLNQDFEGGARHFTAALKLAGNDARLNQNAALSLEMQGEMAESEPYWNRYFDLLDRRLPSPPGMPDYVDQLAYECLSRLATKFSEKERWQAALNCIQRASRLRPNDSDTLERLFHLYNQAKRPQDAKKTLKQLRELKPNEPQYDLYELDVIEVKGLPDIERLLNEIDRILLRHPGDVRVEERAVVMVGNIIPLMGNLCDQLTDQMGRVIDQVRNVPSYQQVNWPAVHEVMRDLQREFTRLRRITNKCLPLVHQEEHRRIVRDLSEHIDRKIQVCREMGA